jgi:hypothetical protein
MAHTKVTKTGTQNTGTANTFSYSGSFNVFKASEVEVELDNVKLTFTTSTINESASPREYTVDYSAKTIHIGGADLAGTNSVVIQPVTDMGAPTPRATYSPGSSVTSDDLNNNQLQLMRKAMEYDEQKLSSRGGTMTGNLHFAKDIDITFEGDTDNAYETTLTVADPTSDKTITLPDTTGTVVTTGDTATVTATMLAANSVDSSELVDGSIDTSHIGNAQVTTDKIAADAVTGAKIADDAINSEHYTDGSIDTAHIADSQVTTAKIADTAVTTAKITDGNITTAKIAADAITAAKIADDVVNSEHYVAGSIDTEHIADSQVTTAKIAADAVTNAKIADDQIDSEHYVDGSIDTAHIGDDQVTTAKIADANVTTAKLATDAVTTVKITDANVTTAKIAADAVTGAKIADDAVDSEHLAADSIDAEHYAAASVDTTALASNAVTTAKITDSNVTTVKVADSNITLAKLASDLKQTSISNSDTQLPTSGAVVDYVAAQIAPLGGLEVIADEDNFPTSQPSSGVVISISDAAGIVVNGSGVSTTARTAGNGSDNVTINNFPSSLYGETLASGVGLMVSSTGSSQTYNYHKILAAETDVKQLSDDINDFNARYRVNAGEPGSSNDTGDLVFDTNASKMKVYDGSSWGEVTSTGDFKYLFLCPAGGTGAPTLDGSIATYDLRESSNSGSAASVTSAAQLIVSVNGVIQKANTGTSAPAEGFALVDANTIIFGANLASGDSVFIVQIGSAVSIPTPGDGTVSAAKIASGAVTTAKIADANVTQAKLADQAVNEAKLQISNAPTNGYFLSAQSGNTGGLTWAAVASDLVDDTSPQLGGDLASNGNDIDFADNDKAIFGTGGDLEIYHASGDNNSYIHEAGSGHLVIKADDLYIQNASGSQTNIKSTSGGAVELSHAGTKKFETVTGGVYVYGDIVGGVGGTGNIFLGDDSKFIAGSGSDLKMYHSGSHSYIKHTGTGNFYIDVNTDDYFQVTGAESETLISAQYNGSVDLFHNGSKKFETTSGGINVTGNVKADGIRLDDNDEIRVGTGDDLKILHSGGTNIINAVNGDLHFEHSNTAKAVLTGGAFRPASNGNIDLGTSSYRWQDVYTSDLDLSNEAKGPNDIDGTWGHYTIVEGESDLFLKNHRNGKTYKFNLTEVS